MVFGYMLLRYGRPLLIIVLRIGGGGMPAEHGTGEHGGFLGFGDAGFFVEPVGGFAACLARIAFVGLRAAICSASNTDQLTRGWQCTV